MTSSIHANRKFFGGNELAEPLPGESLDARIERAIRYMATQAHSNIREIDEAVRAGTSRELSRKIAAAKLNDLSARGIDVRNARIMDLGAGLGMVSEEAATRGANPIAVEPGSGFREIVLERIRRAGHGSVVAAVAENLPFRDDSFDVIISVEVLEHVKNPAAVLQEVFRVLKPGGWFYMTCPNYLSFREVHYNIVWLPLLPKPLGSLYLRLRRRPTEFLLTSITYVTLPWIRQQLKSLGFESLRERNISALCRSPGLANSPWKRTVIRTAARFVPVDVLSRSIAWLTQTAYLCTPRITEVVQKPGFRGSSPK